MLNSRKTKRLELIDTIRGLTLISMIIYHFIWDLVYLYGADWEWFKGSTFWQQCICQTFIILSGFSFSLGRRHLQRGLMVFGGGVLVSLATIIFLPTSRVLFGILTLLGTAMLIMIPLEKPLRKIPPFLGAVISLAIFLFTRNCCYGFVGFCNFKIALPSWLYQNYFTAFLGFPQSGFYSMDYFPIFPWFFLFAFGFFLYKLLEKRNLNKTLFAKGRLPVVSFLGKHSLFVYLIHQPIIYGICEGINFLTKG